MARSWFQSSKKVYIGPVPFLGVRADILGPLVVTDDHGPVSGLTASKPRAVLSLLALNAGSTVSYGKLYRGLWGESEPDSALKLIQGYVSDLRKVVGKDRIETCP